MAQCPDYQGIRKKYFDKDRIDSYQDFINIMKDEQTDNIRKTSWFVFLMDREVRKREDLGNSNNSG